MIPLRDTQRSEATPVVTLTLIIMNAAVFLYEVMLDGYSRNHFVAEFGLIPARLQFFDLLTHMFLHGGWMHLIGNMWFLWIFGDNIEDILGRQKYLLFYIGCGIAAGLAQVFMNQGSRVPMVGASGAIAGVMGAYLVKFPHSRIVMLIPILIFLTTVELPAVVVLIYWFVWQFWSGWGSIAEAHLSRGGVAWFAHVGGFVAGMALIAIMKTREAFHWRREIRW
jgi:membrane associated rhomboid family serine protease